MSDKYLTGKVAIVTGAGGGMGSVMTLGLVDSGARVAVVDVEGAWVEAVVKKAVEIGGEGSVLPIVADVTRTEDCERIIEQTLAKFGAIYVLVNNAGIGMQAIRKNYINEPVRFWEADLDCWQRMMDVNWKGPYMLARRAAPHMIAQGWGRIINVTTSLDTMHRRAYTPYGPSKAALEAASSSWAKDLEGTGVTVNVLVLGGLTNTGLIPGNAPVDRASLVQPEVMVAPICWLASDDSDGVNDSRFVGRDWDTSLPPSEAAQRSKAPAAWPGIGTQAT
ncbi:SDR family oxidoreductase [Acidobacteria bacterium AH-259-D05]|nr:SDR family oxidoreductase [Acidobacteria bacterium AH-259-D05]